MIFKKQKLIIFLALTIVFSFFVFSNLALAQAPDLGNQYAGQIGLGSQDIRTTIASVIRTALGLLGIIVVVLMIYAGFLWMTAGGDEDKVAQSKKILFNSVIGLMIILSAYAITSFIISKLVDATTAVPLHCTNGQKDINLGEIDVDCGGECGDCGGDCVGANCTDDFSRNFYINSLFNGGDVCVRNFHPTITFTQDVQADTVTTDVFYLTKDSDAAKTPVSGKWQLVAGTTNIMEFIPDGVCGGGSVDCLDASTNYTFSVDETKTDNVKSLSNMSLSCALKAENCRDVSFKTGVNVDVKNPTITIKSPSGDLEKGSVVPVVVDYDDENGVQSVSIFDNGRYVDTVRPAVGHNCDAKGTLQASWNTANRTIGLHTLRANGLDWSGRVGSSESRVDLRGSGCYVEPPVGNCGKGDGEVCVIDADCFSGYCDPITNLCAAKIKITGFGPKSGTPGTFVTLAGRYFGTTVGHVYFASTTKDQPDINTPSDWAEASLPTNCGGANMWTTNQITVVVPPKATKGPIKVVTAVGVDGKTSYDLTNDNFGPNLGIFTVDDKVHPKLCEVVPNQGKIGDAVVLRGLDFQTDNTHVFNKNEDQVLFGAVAANIASWRKDSINTTIPVGLAPGRFAAKVSARINNVLQDSNTLLFTVVPGENSTLPFIDGIAPERGSAGEYITITGKNFGKAVGTVWFKFKGEGQAVMGSLSFPKDCDIPLWTDDKILVKFPADQAEGDYSVQVLPGVDGAVVSSMFVRRFRLESGMPAPGICKLSPADVPVSLLNTQKVAVVGEYLKPKLIVPTNGLVFHVSFDQNPVVNEVTPPHQGVMTNTNLVPGQIGTAASFMPNDSGTSGTVLFNLPTDNKIEFSDKDFVISLWYKSNSATSKSNEYLINRVGGGANDGYWQFKKFANGNGISFQVYDHTNDTTVIKTALFKVDGINIFNNEWHNLTGVLDRTKKQLRTYVDGKLSAVTSIEGLGKINTNNNGKATLTIGDTRLQNDQMAIDDVRIYDRVLSADEINDMYLIGSGQTLTSKTPEVYFAKKGSSNAIDSMSVSAFSSIRDLNPGQEVLVIPGLDTISGMVVLRRPGDGKISNALQFGAVSCLKNNNTCTNDGDQCCSDGLCRDHCQGVKLNAGYIWRFSTREIIDVPRVVEDCSDKPNANRTATIPSPSPSTMWNGADNNDNSEVCRTALITVKFNTALKSSSIKSSNVFVRQCDGNITIGPVAGGVNGEICKNPGPILELAPGSLDLQVASTDNKGIPKNYLSLQLKDNNQWEPGKTYQVVLTKSILSDNISLETSQPLGLAPDKICNADNSAYCFSFVAGNKPCELKSLTVAPESFLTTVLSGANGPIRHREGGLMKDLKYKGLGQSTQHCILMNIEGYDWVWNITKTGGVANTVYAQIFGAADQSMARVSSIGNTVGAGLTNPDDSVNVQAAVSKVGMAPVDPATSPLKIDLSNPVVVEHWPDCQEACTNAEIGVRFNTSISQKNLLNGALQLLECNDENCLHPTSAFVAAGVPMPNSSENYTVVRIANATAVATTLKPDTWYKVVISTSTPDGANGTLQLWSLGNVSTLDSKSKPLNQEFFWRFKTKATSCLIDRVGVVPAEFTAETSKAKTVYNGEAYSSPDTCAAKGQKLNPWSVSWHWNASDILVAKVYNFSTTKSINQNCTNMCVRKGSDFPLAATAPLCGNNIVEAGEDCDPPLKEGNNTRCTLNCLYAGNSLKGTNTRMCGNSIVESESGEECDPPNLALGCSNTCLNLGSKPADKVGTEEIGSICGNGKIALGEDCDLGIPALYTATTSAMNCSSVCTHTGTKLANKWCTLANGEMYNGFSPNEYGSLCASSLSLCGDTYRSLNEDDCETDTSGVIKADCNNICLKKTGECSSTAEGCTATGVWRGSSLSYSAPSVCGDGQTGMGEENFCEDPAKSVSGGDPRVLVEGVGQATIAPSFDATSNPPRQVTNINALATNPSLADLRIKNQTATAFGKFIIPCGYNTDEECRVVTGSDDGVVGANSCCYIRPRLVSVYPATTTPPNILDGICPNTYLEATFDQPIDEKTLSGNFVIAKGVVPHGDKILQLAGIRDMKVFGNRAYAVGNNKFYILSTIVPWNPRIVKEVALSTFGSGLNGAGALEVDSDRHIVYIVGPEYVEILNIADENNIRHFATLRYGESSPGVDGDADIQTFPFAIAKGRNTNFPNKEFVYIISKVEAGVSRVEVVDVTSPSSPKHFAKWEKQVLNANVINKNISRFGLWEIKVVGNYVFTTAVNSNGASLDILSLNSADNTITSKHQISLEDPSGLAVIGPRLYVMSEKQKFNVFDIINPEDPKLLSSIDLEETHHNTDFTDKYHASRMIISGQYAHVAMEGFRSVVTVDISSSTKPEVINRNYVQSAALGVERVGDYLLINDGSVLKQIDEDQPAGGLFLNFINIQQSFCRGAEDVTKLVALDQVPVIAETWYRKMWSSLVSIWKHVFGDEVVASAVQVTATKWCAGEDLGTAQVVNDPVKRLSKIVVNLNDVLASDTEYAIILKDGVKDTRGVSIGGQNGKAINWKFATASEICAIDKIAINPASYLFRSAGSTTDLQTMVFSASGQNIQATASYFWNFVWSPIANGIVTWSDTVASVNRVKSENRNGTVTVRASANVVIAPAGQARGRVATAESKLIVNLCENAWPPISKVINNVSTQIWPYEDKKLENNDGFDVIAKEFTGRAATSARGYFNFSTFYCADNGASNNASDDLPYLRPAIQTSISAIEGTSIKKCQHDSTKSCVVDSDCPKVVVPAPVLPYPKSSDVNGNITFKGGEEGGLVNVCFAVQIEPGGSECNISADCGPEYPFCWEEVGNFCIKPTFPAVLRSNCARIPEEYSLPPVKIITEYKAAQKQVNDVCEEVGIDSATTLKRFIFTNDKNSDAIGMQIFANPTHFSLKDWYAAQNLGGNLGTVKVAGYDALADNNNIYVDAVNLERGTGQDTNVYLYTNIYLFSINADAKPETRQVFEQVIKNLKFNINVENKGYCSGNSEMNCQTDFDCPTGQTCYALIDKMKRNMTRLRDLSKIGSSMKNYADGHNNAFPDLREGSLLPGQSISTWPSWSAALGNTLGSVLPKDPIDRLGAAGTCTDPAHKNDYCLSDADCAGFTPATCNFHDSSTGWSTYERRFSFACATSSLAYRYIYKPAGGYEVRTRMENTIEEGGFSIPNATWTGLANQAGSPFYLNLAENHFSLFDLNGICNQTDPFTTRGEVLTISAGTCGDGIVQVGTEACDPPGVEKFEECINNKMAVQVCGTDSVSNKTCQWVVSSTPSRDGKVSCSYFSKCGNGRLEIGETCDDGILNGTYGHCNKTCNQIGDLLVGYCGDGIVQSANEYCDTSVALGKCQFTAGVNIPQDLEDEPIFYFLVDVSGSMSGAGLQSVKTALPLIARSLGDKIKIGISSFTTNNNDRDSVGGGLKITQVLPLGFYKEADVMTAVSLMTSSNLTPTGLSVKWLKENVFAQLDPDDLPRPKNLILITDGDETTKEKPPVPPIADRALSQIGILKTEGILTYILAVGGTTARNFNLWAVAGGTTSFIPVGNNAIADQVLSIYRKKPCRTYSVTQGYSCAWDCRSIGSYCGDGKVDVENGEECDGNTVCSIVNVSGNNLCSSKCKFISPAIAWWRFDSADTRKDYSSNKYHALTCTGHCPAPVEGKLGLSANFNGTTSYLTVPDKANLRSSHFSLEAWIKLSPVGQQMLADSQVAVSLDGNTVVDQGVIVAKQSAEDCVATVTPFHACGDNHTPKSLRGYSLYVGEDRRVRFAIGVGSSRDWEVSGSPTALNSDWTHVAAVYDGAIQSLFVNGVLVASHPIGISYIPTTTPLKIGNTFDGQIDELAYYNRALTSDEIAYNATHNQFCSTTAALPANSVSLVSNEPRCGDSKIDADEACDKGDGPNGNGIACTPTYNKSCTYCSVDCKNVVEVKPSVFCGDGIIQSDVGELCETDPATKEIWAAKISSATFALPIGPDPISNGFKVKTCAESTIDLLSPYNLGVSYLVGDRRCVSCAVLDSECEQCGVVPSDKGVAVSSTIINALYPGINNKYPLTNNPTVEMYASSEALNNGKRMTKGQFNQVGGYFNKVLMVNSNKMGQFYIIAHINENEVCRKNDSQMYKMVLNDDFAHSFNFPVSPVSVPGQYDLVVSPTMRDVAESNNIRIVAIWFGKESSYVSEDAGGFVRNVANSPRAMLEGGTIENSSDYYTKSNSKKFGMWYHGASVDTGATYVESYTVDTNALTEDMAFYIRSNNPIKNEKNNLRVEVYYPDATDQAPNHYSRPVTYYFNDNTQSSDNDYAGYWHVLNIKKAAGIPDIKNRLVEINQIRTSPQFFEFR